jgi:hypothetical protein
MTLTNPPANDNVVATAPPRIDGLGRFTWGAVVAIVALLILGAVFVVLAYSTDSGADLATAFGAIATPVVAIASAYFGIQVAGKAAEGANASAASANAAAASAGTAATEATDAAKTAASAATDAVSRSDEVIAFAQRANPSLFS